MNVSRVRLPGKTAGWEAVGTHGSGKYAAAREFRSGMGNRPKRAARAQGTRSSPRGKPQAAQRQGRRSAICTSGTAPCRPFTTASTGRSRTAHSGAPTTGCGHLPRSGNSDWELIHIGSTKIRTNRAAAGTRHPGELVNRWICAGALAGCLLNHRQRNR